MKPVRPEVQLALVVIAFLAVVALVIVIAKLAHS